MAFEARVMVQRPNLAIGFLSFFGCVFLIALRAGWFMSFGILFKEAAALFDVGIPTGIFGKVRPFKPLGDFFRAIDNKMMRWLGEGISRTGHAFIEFALWVAYTVTMIGVAIAAIGYELGLEGVRMIRRTSPEHIQTQAKPAIKAATLPVPRIKVVADSRVPALAREVKTLEARLEHVADSIALPAPVTIPREIPKIGQLEHAWDWTRARAGKLAGLGTIAGLIGLTAAVLSRLGLGWARCSKVGRAGRGVCGMNEDLLSSLLADALLVVGAISIVEFAKELQAIEAATVSAMRGFVREV